MLSLLLWPLLVVGAASESPLSPPVGFLDLDEINSVKYDINIGNQPVLFTADLKSDFAEFLPMVNKYGQKYRCSLPTLVDEAKESDETVDGGVGNEKTDPSSLLENSQLQSNSSVNGTARARQLLEPMSSQPCLLRTKDWWTYEFCYGRTVKQYHMEDGRAQEPVMVLGFYDHDEEWTEDESSDKETSDEFGEHKQKIPKQHHSQLYANGSKCDLTGNLRHTEVRFECDPNSVVDVISQVTEPQSCEYLITVTTSRICAIPQLRPPPVKKPKKIECQPVLTQEEFDKYELYKVAQEKLAEKKAEESKVAEKDRLLKVLDGEDLTGINMDTEEGMEEIERMVGNKMAEKLVTELGSLFGAPVTKKVITSSKDLLEVEEYTLPSGEKQTRLVKKNAFTNMLDEIKTDSAKNKAKKTDVHASAAEKSVNIDPRSDLSSEDEMIEELIRSVKQLTKTEMDSLKDLKSSLKDNVEESIEDILEETEGEMNMKLDGVERHNAIEELSKTLHDIMAKLEKAETDINRANNEIDQLQNTITEREDELETLKREGGVSKEIIEEEAEVGVNNAEDSLVDEKLQQPRVEEEPKVNIKVTNMNQNMVAGLKDSPTEQRVVKHLERAIKDKLSRSGLDTGGRQIEVKLITTAIPSEMFNDATGESQADSGNDMSPEEAKQFQSMVYNLMINNQEAYEEIDNQRKAEISYNFKLKEIPEMHNAEDSNEGITINDDAQESEVQETQEEQ